MWLDILQTELNFGITKLSLLTSKTKRIVTYYTQRQCHFDDFFRDILSCGQLILCCVGNSRSLSITVRIKNACSICVGKMVWKKSDSDYFQLSEMVLWNREIVCVCVCCVDECVLVAQLCPTLCSPMEYIPPGSPVHVILQAGILEWVATSFSREHLS